MKKIYSINDAMELAIAEAKKGLSEVSPNPPVGCVILSSDFELLAVGHHERFGGPHAEINALNKIEDKDLLAGAHLVVTLEPCSHHGKTPPCAEEIIKYKLASVVFGVRDPNPKVAGKGAEIILSAGIEAKVFDPGEDFAYLVRELELLIDVFRVNILEKRTFYALKIASSMDGQVAHQSGQSQWITNECSREEAHKLRSQYSAVLVGANTLLTDDPRLNIRLEGEEIKNKVIILDPKGKCLDRLETLNISKVRGMEDIFVVVQDKGVAIDYSGPAKIISGPFLEDSCFNLGALSKVLFEMDIYSCFVEGGAHTLSSFFAQESYDRFYYFIAPCVIGSKSGLSWTKNMEIPSLRDKLGLRLNSAKVLKGDILLDYSKE